MAVSYRVVLSLCARPAEVSCVKVEHRFVRGVPSSPECFLIPESEVVSPKIRSGKHGGTVVYTNPLGHEKFVSLLCSESLVLIIT